MARKSFTERIKVTKSGKFRRRATTLGHARANKRQVQLHRKKRERSLDKASQKKVAQYLK